MLREEIEHPAIVKVSLADLIERIRDLNSMIDHRERLSLKEAIETGKLLLRAKELCQHGEWENSLKKMCIKSQRASEFMRIAKSPAPGISNCKSIREAMAVIGEVEDESPPVVATNQLLCRPCRTTGEKPDCKECAKLNAPPSHANPPRATTGTETTETNSEVSEPTDLAGHNLPEKLIPIFDTVEKFKAMDSEARALQKELDEVSKGPGGDLLVRLLKPTGSEEKTINKSEHLNALKRDLRFTRPYSVCPWCKGTGKKDCHCNGLGWIGELTWNDCEDAVKARL